ncbi:hypothetical protein [Actinoplanes regularis]|uniref:Four helix bundle sensory module for signal transduction n=1 Tax=Actinoplanes regularis TaxID=52697 RepID=A0A239AF90_9ACTN|nr:hypothetical protein [Actinoplanes regularis]GIE86880.1 hypothetical protein Are01nite_33600 [Actinoplanes regularis]SNR94032.1 hypothetical protein SAMN06264365_107285 [Actinoplanes regularis]
MPRLTRRLVTPDLYRLIAATLVVLGLALGGTALATVHHRSGLTRDITGVSGPLSVSAQELYRSLSDADATAANAFLANGAEPAALRQRYLDDLAQAGAALTVAARDADDADTARLAVLTDQLPVYSGLVETARSYNRLGVPLGGAYLREASALMRQTLLPQAQALFESAQGRLGGAQRDAAGLPWPILLLGLLAVAALLTAQVLLARRTNRVFNVGLVAASLVALIMLAWSAVALGAAATRVEAGRQEGSKVVTTLATARRAALQARADEALTLVARAGSGAMENDYDVAMRDLAGLLGAAAVQAPEADRKLIRQAREHASRWQKLHDGMRELDDKGDYLAAVAKATATGPADLPAAFSELDSAVSAALAVANERVARQAGNGGRALTGLEIALLLLTAGLTAAVILGFRPRIGEYR